MIKKNDVKKTKIKKPKFFCLNCNNEVLELDNHVLLITSKRGKIVEEVIFHEDCWKEYFNKAVTKKAKQNVAKVQSKVMSLMDNPMVKSLLANVKGTDNLMAMLQMPLTKDTVEKVKEKINNDRKSKPKRAKA